LLVHSPFHIRITQASSGPIVPLAGFRDAPCNNAQAIERIAALTVGLWGPPEGMVFRARAASRLEFPTVLR
jgi:hypothetical protein